MNLYHRRKWAIIIDLLAIAVIGSLVTFGMPADNIEFVFFPSVKNFFANLVVYVSFLLKDVLFRNASIGKKTFNVSIVSQFNGEKPNIWRIILRNITLVIWPVEVYLVLYKQKTRLGDRLAKTKVVLNQEVK